MNQQTKIDPQTASVQEMWEWLAGRETDCGGKYAFHDTYPTAAGPCPRCGGTGQVALLPLLRRPCAEVQRFVNHYGYEVELSEPRSCPDCKGRGWVPVPPSLEVLIQALRAAGYAVELHSAPWNNGYVAVKSIDATLGDSLGYDLLAVCRAAVKALQAAGYDMR